MVAHFLAVDELCVGLVADEVDRSAVLHGRLEQHLADGVDHGLRVHFASRVVRRVDDDCACLCSDRLLERRDRRQEVLVGVDRHDLSAVDLDVVVVLAEERLEDDDLVVDVEDGLHRDRHGSGSADSDAHVIFGHAFDVLQSAHQLGDRLAAFGNASVRTVAVHHRSRVVDDLFQCVLELLWRLEGRIAKAEIKDVVGAIPRDVEKDVALGKKGMLTENDWRWKK